MINNNLKALCFVMAISLLAGCKSNDAEQVRIIKEKEYITVNKYSHHEIPEELLKVEPSPRMPKDGIKSEEQLLDYIYRLKEHSLSSRERILSIKRFINSSKEDSDKKE